MAKRSSSWGDDGSDPLKKVRRTIGWYNKNGGLAAEINYKAVKGSVEAIDPMETLKILKGLEEKAGQIRDPTNWLKKAASKRAPDLDPKLKKTIMWYNKHGGLTEQIWYNECKGPLSQLPLSEALRILKGLEGKGATIKNPTSWISGAATRWVQNNGSGWGSDGSAAGGGWGSGGKGGGSFPTDTSVAAPIDEKVRKTIVWYNKHAGFQSPIDYGTVAPLLAQMGPAESLKLLKEMDGKGPSIRNPTAWISSAVKKLWGQTA